MIRPGHAKVLHLLHHVQIARTERREFMAVALLFGHLQIPPCMEFYASQHIVDTTLSLPVRIVCSSTSAMNQASDSRRTRPTPSKSLQTIKQMKIHVPNDAIASLTPSWESSKCPVLKIFIKYPYFPKIYMLPCNPLLENPCFQSGNHVMVRLILKNISKTVSQCIPCIPHALLLTCSKACVDTSRNLQKDQGGTL